jgi:hypothetical protein
MHEVYSDASSLGVFTSTLWLYIAMCICIIFVIISIYLFSSRKTLETTKAIITNASCNTSFDSKSNARTATCTIDIEYFVEYKKYANKLITTDKYHDVGDQIDVSYDINNPDNVYYNTFSTTSIALILLCIGAIILGSAYLQYYLSSNYKIYAAGTGASNIVALFK